MNSGGVIYAIRMSGHPFYKIGWSSSRRGVLDRLVKLQTGNPYTLEIIGVINGTMKDEGDLHWKLSLERVGFSEWFQSSDRIQELLRSFEPIGIEPRGWRSIPCQQKV